MIALYTSDPGVSQFAFTLVTLAIVFIFTDSVAVPIQGILRGYKDINMALLISFIVYWCLCLPLGYVLPLTDWLLPPLGAKGFWLAMIVSVIVASFALAKRYLTIRARSEGDLSRANDSFKTHS